MRVLDLFCGQGGASKGYADAGFDVIGIDTAANALRRYPFDSARMDWREGLARYGGSVDLIHASPPCQRYTRCGFIQGRQDHHPDLIEPVREALKATGKPYVIENVPGSPLIDPLELCGCMFHRTVRVEHMRFALYRPRRFELHGLPLVPVAHQPHELPALPVFGNAYPYYIFIKYGIKVPGAKRCELMGCEWMTQSGVKEAIPPCFTRWLGERFLVIGHISTRGQVELAA